MSGLPGSQHPAPQGLPLTALLSSDVYVFGVGPLVDLSNIEALASKKEGERHSFKVKDMEDLENVFFQMIGRKMQGHAFPD